MIGITREEFEMLCSNDARALVDINIDKESDDKYLNLINSLRHEVNDLSVDNKEKTMKYVKNLVQLSTIYNQ